MCGRPLQRVASVEDQLRTALSPSGIAALSKEASTVGLGFGLETVTASASNPDGSPQVRDGGSGGTWIVMQ